MVPAHALSRTQGGEHHALDRGQKDCRLRTPCARQGRGDTATRPGTQPREIFPWVARGGGLRALTPGRARRVPPQGEVDACLSRTHPSLGAKRRQGLLPGLPVGLAVGGVRLGRGRALFFRVSWSCSSVRCRLAGRGVRGPVAAR